jgi:integrase
MPKIIQLSWQPGVGNREGRWKKFYRGKAYYFPGGKGKSDREGYDAAWAAWESLKAKIDRDAPRQYQREYDAAIDRWEQVLAWSNRYGERQIAAIAYEKLELLRKRLEAPLLRPLDRSDCFEARFDTPDYREIFAILDQHEKSAIGEYQQPSPCKLVDLAPIMEHGDAIDGSPRRIAQEIWRDRLEIQSRGAASEDESLQGHVKRYLEQKGGHAKAGEVSDGHVYALQLHLNHFRDWLGKNTSVCEIDGRTLTRYHGDLLARVAAGDWGRTTASDYMTATKSFVRWLWQIEAIPALPRVLDGKSQALKIGKPAPKVIVFTKEEIQSLLAAAADRTSLYILLMLNCGMTQKDIADLLVLELDWKEGRIIRKRSKTGDCENVPTVNYKLWPETLRLLLQERAPESKDRVLLNSNGIPIWSEQIDKDGKYKKSDNVKNAFDRLRKKLNIKKPLKSLKKTSASLLRDNAQFSALAGLFLGHAPVSMSDRHYTQVPQGLLDQALTWLGQEFGLIERPEQSQTSTSQKRAGRSPDSPDGVRGDQPAEATSAKSKVAKSKVAKKRPTGAGVQRRRGGK